MKRTVVIEENHKESSGNAETTGDLQCNDNCIKYEEQ